MSEKETQKEANGQTVSRTAYISVAIFILLLVVGVVLIARDYQSKSMLRQAVILRQQTNRELGLPLDYPADVLPIYPGLIIVAADRESATSTLGEPMDKWVVHGEIATEKEPVKDFYQELLIDAGFSQKYFIGLPTGYGMDYGNDVCAISLVIEFRQPSELLQVDITIHRLRE